MNGRPPLSALLSHALVAFIIEFDNEFENLAPHQTSRYGGTPQAPWLVSMIMWMRFLRYIPDEGIAAALLPKAWGLTVAETRRWIARQARWWGHIVAGPVVRTTPGGLKAREVWRGLSGVVEKRWVERFGHKATSRLQKVLSVIAERFTDLPDFLPILGYGLWSTPDRAATGTLDLPALLSKALLGFAVEYESHAAVSLAIGANVLRLVPDEGLRLRDLPRLSGVSKEGIAMAAGYLERTGFARTGPSRSFALTEKGSEAREEYWRLVTEIENGWRATELRAALEAIRITPPEPPPGTWRSKIARPAVLPDFPVILHRGGFPDGS